MKPLQKTAGRLKPGASVSDGLPLTLIQSFNRACGSGDKNI
ncbi:hypothetical protein ACTHUM_10090 [Neisseria sp. P0021.S006]